MAPRPYWKGYLKLSLVSCPIALSPATSSSEKISFRQVNKATGNRIRYKKVDSETDEEVTNEDIGKGYEVGKNEFLLMDEEELEAVELESTHTIEIVQFVPFAQIDKRYYDQPYYIVPNDDVGVEAFAVIREAMVGKGVAALGRVVMNKRERVIALEPFGKGLIGTTLHYSYEVRKADDYFDDIPDIKIAPDMLKLAQHIVDEKAGEFEPESFTDHYEEALVEILRKKQAYIPLKRSTERASAPKNVINLMDALRRSIATNDKDKPSAKTKGKKRAEGQREMLLPIAGRKKEAAKDATKPAARRKAG
ncbi:MAG: non-homologous end joining protein Ku [Burkholderiales bacterium]